MTRSTHWAHVQENSWMLGMRILFAVYRLLGKFVFRAALYPVMLYYFCGNRVAREASLEYLRQLAQFAPDVNVRANLFTAFRHFVAFADSMVAKLDVWTGRTQLKHVTFHNHDVLKGLLARKQGVVLLGSHLGNMEVCCALAELRPQLRLNVLVHTQHAEQFNLLLDKVRNGPRKVELIQVTQLTPATAMLLNQRIEAGEFVAIVADRTPVAASDRFVTASFLGRDAPFPQGPFILAALLQCPVYSLMCPYRNGRYEISAELFAEKIVLPRRDRHGALQVYAAQFSRLLEDHCRRAPLQWFNFYPFWNGTNAQP